MNARQQLTTSLHALLTHLDMGLIQDTALPGTTAAEATRLLKNGLSVSAFACYEHFIRTRIAELLTLVRSSPDLPPFENLPEGLQLAATRGVVEALRFRLSVRGDALGVNEIVETAQVHALAVASTRANAYSFSDWTFGHNSSNVGAGTLNDLFNALGVPKLYSQIRDLLELINYDYAAAGLVEGAKFKLGKISSWRHEAAHDATLSIDVALLRTRISAYLAVAFAFDALASFATRVLVDSFGDYGSCDADLRYLSVQQLNPDSEQFQLQDLSGTSRGKYYSQSHCEDALDAKAAPLTGAVVVRGQQQQIIDWFFY